MDRETFARRLREATAMCRTLAMTYLKEDLPQAYRYRVRLNSSYDGNPLDPDEVVFPGDSAPERQRPLPGLPRLEELILRDSNLRGPGLSALAPRCPQLRALHIYGVGDGFDAREGPALSSLTTLSVAGALARPCGLAAWADRLPLLETLKLWAADDLCLDDALPARIGTLTLMGLGIAGRAPFPHRIDRLSIRLPEQDPAALEALLAPIQIVKSLGLSRTPVGDDLVARLVARWPLSDLTVIETSVSKDFLRRLAREQPALDLRPRA